MVRSSSRTAIVGLANSVNPRIKCRCASLRPSAIHAFTTSSPHPNDNEGGVSRYSNEGRNLREGPRWASTPPRMIAPVRSKPPVFNNDFEVNNDPVKLDRVYRRTLGEDGENVLTDEVKWLAVTHKSFDHGRRGYNDRLAFLGTQLNIQPLPMVELC